MKTQSVKLKTYLLLILIVISFNSCKISQNKEPNNYNAYLFTYFTGNNGAEESIRYALSKDGYNYYALNNNEPIISSKKISSTGGVRDPHILRGHDGKTFYMVVTDMVSANGWSSNRAMVLLKSTDLINWTSSVVNIQKRFQRVMKIYFVFGHHKLFMMQKKKNTWCIGL